jgi:hypothetical protein
MYTNAPGRACHNCAMSNLEKGSAASAGTWTDITRQLKQKRCHECSKRTFYSLFEAEGAVCRVCVNLRTMPRPIPQSASVAETANGKKHKSTIAPTIKNAILAKRACGQSKLSIAEEMHVAPGTVRNVLNEADFDQQVQQRRLDSVRLIPAAINGLEKSGRAHPCPLAKSLGRIAEADRSETYQENLANHSEPQIRALAHPMCFYLPTQSCLP